MVIALKCRVIYLCILIALATPHLVAKVSGYTSNLAPVRGAKEHEGLLDFALKRANPSDVDYGQCLDQARKLILEQTLDRGYFWSNVAALSLVGVFFLVIVHQQRLQDRREVIASESLTQYHNALARAEEQAREATKRNHALMETLTTLSEASVTRLSAESLAPKDGPTKERKQVQNPDKSATAASLAPIVAAARGEFPRLAIAASTVAKTSNSSTQEDSTAAVPVGVSVQGGDLVERVNALQQQVNVYKEREKQLLRQVNDAELSLQKERQRNRNLKGE